MIVDRKYLTVYKGSELEQTFRNPQALGKGTFYIDSDPMYFQMVINKCIHAYNREEYDTSQLSSF